MEYSEPRKVFADAWAASMTSVVETMIAAAPRISWQAIEGAVPAAPDDAPRVWWVEGLSAFSQPSIWIGATAGAWKGLGQAILASLGVDDAGDEDVQSTCRDVVAQVASGFAAEMAKLAGGAVNSTGASSSSGPGENVILAALDVEIPQSTDHIEFVVAFHPSLFGALGMGPDAAQAGGAADAAAEAETVFSEPIAELRFPVYARLGSSQVQLGDVFRWTVGSVIEIGRRLTEPIDVLVGGRLIAKGQVVVSNGFYGARVVSIEHPSQGDEF
jgi:flagellar motor switch protein FliN/FliY